jgi:hypothetical protein
MKNTADDTIYRTSKGTRVRIVKDKEFPPNPLDPDWLKEIKAKPSETITVSEVKNGKRWYGYSREDLMTEVEFLKKIK